MFKFKKLIGKLAVLSIMLSALGFVVTASAEKAPPTECRTCIKVPNKDIWFYCQWTQTHIACPTVPPPDAICTLAGPYCDPI